MSEAQVNIISSLSEEEVAEIEAEIACLPNRHSAAIDALKIVQSYRGWISDESLAAIARLLDMSVDELDGIATFYNLIFRKPVGEKIILVCDSVSCWIMGCEAINSRITKRLGINPGETTADGKYTLIPITCLGDCDHAPVMMIDKELHHDLTVDSIDELFDVDAGGES
ncbi:MAG: NADH-quinone oxidoreductase subunit NuoE [Pseudomonadales bacterium]